MNGYEPADVNIDLSGMMSGIFDEIVASLLDLMLTVLPTVMVVVGAVITIRLALAVFKLILNSDAMISRDFNNESDDFIREARRNEQLERYGYFDSDDDEPDFWGDEDVDGFDIDDVNWNKIPGNQKEDIYDGSYYDDPADDWVIDEDDAAEFNSRHFGQPEYGDNSYDPDKY